MFTNYAVVAFDMGKTEVLHMCFFEIQPSEETIMGIVEELAKDEEFGMTGMVYLQDYQLAVMSGERLGMLKKALEIPDNVE